MADDSELSELYGQPYVTSSASLDRLGREWWCRCLLLDEELLDRGDPGRLVIME